MKTRVTRQATIFFVIWLMSHGIMGQHWHFHVGIYFSLSSSANKGGFVSLSGRHKFGRQLAWLSRVFPHEHEEGVSRQSD